MRNASALFRLVAPMIATGILLAGCGPSAEYNPDICPVRTVRPPPPDGDRTETDPAKLPPCSIVTNPANGREEVVVANIRQTALLIGDSQSEPAVGWPREALTAMGYDVFFAGASGTGFVAGHDRTGNYPEALQRGDWRLPYGSPPLAVIQGGGRRTEVDALLGRVAAHHAIPFVSVGDWMSKYRLGQFAADGVHLSTEGHQELGAVLGEKFRQLGLHARPPGLGTGQ